MVCEKLSSRRREAGDLEQLAFDSNWIFLSRYRDDNFSTQVDCFDSLKPLVKLRDQKKYRGILRSVFYRIWLFLNRLEHLVLPGITV